MTKSREAAKPRHKHLKPRSTKEAVVHKKSKRRVQPAVVIAEEVTAQQLDQPAQQLDQPAQQDEELIQNNKEQPVAQKEHERKLKKHRTLAQALREVHIEPNYVRSLNNNYATRILNGYGVDTTGMDLEQKREKIISEQNRLNKSGLLTKWHSFRLHYFGFRKERVCSAFVPRAHKMIIEARPPPASEMKRKTCAQYASPSFVEPPSSTESQRAVSFLASLATPGRSTSTTARRTPASVANTTSTTLDESAPIIMNSAAKKKHTLASAAAFVGRKPVPAAPMEEDKESDVSSFEETDVEERQEFDGLEDAASEDSGMEDIEDIEEMKDTPVQPDASHYNNVSDGDEDADATDPVIVRLDSIELLLLELGRKMELAILELRNIVPPMNVRHRPKKFHAAAARVARR